MLGGVQSHPERLFLSALSICYWGQHWVVAQTRNPGALLDASLPFNSYNPVNRQVLSLQPSDRLNNAPRVLLLLFSHRRCCWVASVVSNSVQLHRRQPSRLPHPWDSPGKNTGADCRFLLQCMEVKSESEVAQSCPTFVTKSCPTLYNPIDGSAPGSPELHYL